MDDSGDPVTERAKQRVGNTLKEKWKLDQLIGVGGMAAVYSATHRNGMKVAVKMLHAELSVDNEIRSRFLREGYVANKVEHTGAVSVLDDEVTEDGAVFLVMELLDGETLAHRFERKARSLVVEEILLVADQVLDVLAAAHEKHIVHRDIKPDNIFLTRPGGVKLLDFGIARLRELSHTSATRSGSTMGTPAYMAPEQARARWDEVDGRTDLWAVGATMFKLLTGRVVHVADTINEQLLAAMTQPAPPIATLVPTAPIPVLEVVDKALAFKREDRWRDARSMQRAVRDAYQAIAGISPASVRLSFDEEGVAHADTIAIASKVPTSLTAANDSASFASRRPRRRSALRWFAVLGGLGAVAYFFLPRGSMKDLPGLLNQPDGGGILSGGALGIPSSLSPDSILPSLMGSSEPSPSASAPGTDPAAPGQGEILPPSDPGDPGEPPEPAPAPTASHRPATPAAQPSATRAHPETKPGTSQKSQPPAKKKTTTTRHRRRP